jgi:mannose-6-phosphate isomerase
VERLQGAIQRYAWGDRVTISALQGRPEAAEPEAELWLGSHPAAPSTLAASGRPLTEAIASDPTRYLGPAVAERFGGLPYLLKVLAAAQPLSLQAHPDEDRARAGFERAEAAGLDLGHPTRTYRDPNHKPELICALTPFEAKCGFRPLAVTLELVSALAAAAGPGSLLGELEARLSVPTGPTAAAADHATVLHETLGWLFGLSEQRALDLVTETVAMAGALSGPGPFEAELAWTLRLDQVHPGDIGIVGALLLNHVSLAPGQALFLGAGNLHAYLDGAGVELMANSDNVVRGGLTVKHIDVEELLVVVDTAPGPVEVFTAEPGHHIFAPPVAELALTRMGEGASQWFEPVGPDILLVTEGSAALTLMTGEGCSLDRGDAVFVAWGDGRYRLDVESDAVVWRASVGDPDRPDGAEGA